VNKTVNTMNNAFKNDPAAIRALMCNRVPCNGYLADDPVVQVDLDIHIEGEHFTVGALGLINGVLAANGLPLLSMMWDDELVIGVPCQFLGFTEYVPSVDHEKGMSDWYTAKREAQQAEFAKMINMRESGASHEAIEKQRQIMYDAGDTGD